MKCQYCNKDFQPESLIQLSHDVPCYLFLGNRKGQSNQADKWGRHHLCQECHEKYEKAVREFLQKKAKEFSLEYFKGDLNGDCISKI